MTTEPNYSTDDVNEAIELWLNDLNKMIPTMSDQAIRHALSAINLQSQRAGSMECPCDLLDLYKHSADQLTTELYNRNDVPYIRKKMLQGIDEFRKSFPQYIERFPR